MANENGGTGVQGEGATGTGSGNPNPNAATGTPADKGVSGATGATGTGEKVYTYKEDRTDWTPRHRLNEVSGKLTVTEQRALKAEQELESERKRTRALAGLEPVDAKKQETEELRSILTGMFPQLKTLEGLTAEQLQEVMEAARTARSTSQQTWERHAITMLTDLDTEAATALDVDKLSPTQQRNLRRAYSAAASEALAERQAQMEQGTRRSLDTINSDKDFIARHEQGDKTLVKEFVKAFLGDWFEPARRSVTAQQARRNMRPVPRGERTRVLPASGATKVDLNNETDFKKALLAARGSGQE